MGRQRTSQAGARIRRGRAPNRPLLRPSAVFSSRGPSCTPARPSASECVARSGTAPHARPARTGGTPLRQGRPAVLRPPRHRTTMAKTAGTHEKLRNNPAGQICPPPHGNASQMAARLYSPSGASTHTTRDANPPKTRLHGAIPQRESPPRAEDGGRSASHGLGLMPRHNSMWSPKGSWFTRGPSPCPP